MAAVNVVKAAGAVSGGDRGSNSRVVRRPGAAERLRVLGVKSFIVTDSVALAPRFNDRPSK